MINNRFNICYRWKVMFDFIFRGSAEPCGTGIKPTLQNENICHYRVPNQWPLSFQADALDH